MSRANAFLVIVLLLTTTANAYTLNNINLIVDETGRVLVEEKLIVSVGEKEVNLTLPRTYESLKVYERGISLDFRLEETDSGAVLIVPISIDGSRSAELTVSYASSHFTSKKGGVWTLSFPARMDPYRTIMKVTLPQNTTIIDWGPKTRFTPTSNGLFVYPENEDYSFTLNYSLGGTLAEESAAPPYYLIAVILLVVVIMVVAFHRRRVSSRESSTEIVVSPPVEVLAETTQAMEFDGDSSTGGPDDESKEVRIKDSVYQMLDDNEKKIVDVLLSHEDDITQAQICRETGIPKATLSDLMRNLEKHNVVERERDGRRNWVKLKKWVFK